jgi:hypothetical protein
MVTERAPFREARYPRGWAKDSSGASGEVLSFGNESNTINNDGGIDNYLLMRDPLLGSFPFAMSFIFPGFSEPGQSLSAGV